jgi:alcohol dehydrogenase
MNAPSPAFTVGRLPAIRFGAGRSAELAEVVRGFGSRALVVTREPGFTDGPAWAPLEAGLRQAGVEVETVGVSGEPSPSLVDEIVARVRAGRPVDVVVGIGGGSVLDTAKAVAGLLIPGNSVTDHLEGIGPELPYRGPAVPFVAIPTTAGTGSEATKNAVLSVRGPGGFKKSFRDDALVARVAIVDPDLLAGCPPELIAANGMDALTQLLESYVSARANPFTDALALSGLAATRDGLLSWFGEATAGRGGGPGSTAALARERMAYAALCSGICLAQAGLGAVHGLASPLGALFPVPHGVACGATLAATTRVNLAALKERAPEDGALPKYAVVARILLDAGISLADDHAARAALVRLLEDWRVRLAVPRLSAYGIVEADIPAIVSDSRGSSMKTNPIVLTDTEIAAILRASL